MTAVTHSDYAVSRAVMEWLGKIGIEPKGVRSLSIHFDPHDVVTIDVQRIMSKDDIEPFQEFLHVLTPDEALVAERYRIERVRPEE